MSANALEQYIRQLIESNGANKVTVTWQGGELTLRRFHYGCLIAVTPSICFHH